MNERVVADYPTNTQTRLCYDVLIVCMYVCGVMIIEYILETKSLLSAHKVVVGYEIFYKTQTTIIKLSLNMSFS